MNRRLQARLNATLLPLSTLNSACCGIWLAAEVVLEAEATNKHTINHVDQKVLYTSNVRGTVIGKQAD